MPKVLIVYYSHTGNTEKMARAVAEGAKTVTDVEAEVKRDETPFRLGSYDAILIGAPTYQHNMTSNIKNFLEKVAFHNVNLKGRIGAAFGSYGWSGEAPGFALEVMENKFGMNVLKPPLLIEYAPDDRGLETCRELGKKVAKRVSK